MSLSRDIAKKLHEEFGSPVEFYDLSCRGEMRLLKIAEDILAIIDKHPERARKTWIDFWMGRR